MHRPDSEMIISFPTILYEEDLLIGERDREQVDVQTTVRGLAQRRAGRCPNHCVRGLALRRAGRCPNHCVRGLARSKPSRPMSTPAAVGLIPSMFLHCNSYLRVFGTSTRLCSNFSRKRKTTRRARKEGKVSRRRTRKK